ncbi:hypothetical protein RP20_CCG002878 [Aedes albopictus]|nr:hypothetical protein RP20_CCG002878 [Aedes albopictus]
MYGKVKLIALFSYCIKLATGAYLSDELHQYTISVIQHYYQQKPSWFKCVFYDVSAGTDNGLYRNLLSSPQLENVTKFVFDQNYDLGAFNDSLLFKADLTIVYVGDRDLSPSKCPFLVHDFFATSHTNSPLLVLLNTLSFKVFQSIGYMLTAHQFDKVTYVGTREKIIVQMGLFGIPMQIMVKYPHPKDLIRSNIRDSHGRPIRYTYIAHPWEPAQTWINETAIFLNTCVVFEPQVCTSATSPDRCLMNLFLTNHIDITIDHRDASVLLQIYIRMLICVFSTSRIVLVPQARPFNAIEMFTKPFTWGTWLLFLMTFVLIATISFIFPSLFKNDPILLVVCGFQRYNLHYAHAKEKMLLFPLIIFFFLMFNAYGTKMIAFMTNKPSIGNIKTLDELAKSGLKITADLLLDRSLVEDSLLGSQMIHKPIGPDNVNLDGVNAHCTTDFEASTLVSMSRNYDFKLNRPKYAIIDEKISTVLIGYWVGIKSPLAEILYYTQKVFFESGLFNVWQKDLSDLCLNEDRIEYTGNDVEDSRMLSFDDLISTWMVLTIGLLASAAIFGLEHLMKYFSSD